MRLCHTGSDCFVTLEVIVCGVVANLQPEARLLLDRNHLQLISVSVYSGGDHNRDAQTAKRSIDSTIMMLLGHGSDVGSPRFTRSLVSTPSTPYHCVGVEGLSPV